MASSSAVLPFGAAYTSLLWMSSMEVVKSARTSGFSEKVTRKNSSSGFAVLKNSTTASRDLSILLDIDPLTSKITPNETGASSLEKWLISCGWPLSVRKKLSFSSPVTRRFMGSVTVTGTRTRSTSLRMGLVWVLSDGSTETPADLASAATAGGMMVGSGLASFFCSRGTTWISDCSFWATTGTTAQAERSNIAIMTTQLLRRHNKVWTRWKAKRPARSGSNRGRIIQLGDPTPLLPPRAIGTSTQVG